MNNQPTSDALVSYEDGKKWIEELLLAKSDDVIRQAIDTEPAVFGVAAHTADRLSAALMKRGLSQELSQYAGNQVALAGARAILLMQKGNAKLWEDFIGGGSDE